MPSGIPKNLDDETRKKVLAIWEERGDKLLGDEVNKICHDLQISTSTYYRWRTERTGLEDSEIELRKFLKKIKPHAESGKNANYARLYAQLMGYMENKEGRDTNEPSPTEYITIGKQVRDTLRQELKDGGCCPLCCQPLSLRNETRLDSDEGEAAKDSEVATLAVSP